MTAYKKADLMHVLHRPVEIALEKCLQLTQECAPSLLKVYGLIG
jgi:hypothetical protein